METGQSVATGAVTGAAAGMALGPIGAVVGGAVGALGGLWAGLASAAEKRKQVAEALRRNQLQQAQVRGKATATAAASGVEMSSGSLVAYFEAMQSEFDRQNKWTQDTGDAAAGNAILASSLGAVSDLGRTMSNFAQLNNYWRSPSLDAGGYASLGLDVGRAMAGAGD